MANPEQLAIIERGYLAWNAWKEEHPDVTADLHEANLTMANLSLARLVEADLSRAHLLGADLTRADLTGANLSWANLSQADLTNAVLYETAFGDTELTSAKGLEHCRHLGPSILDHRSIAKSGKLPLAFLRGVGLPDRLIDYLPSLLGEALQRYSCFISYSARDNGFTRRLYNELQGHGVRCWFAPEDLKIGERIRTGIDDAIRIHDKLLLVLSQYSVASQWVEGEVEEALAKERSTGKIVLFPVRLDAAAMESEAGWAKYIRHTRNIGDFTRWKRQDAFQAAFERLLRDLRTENATPASRTEA
jgi:hypothetical protein